MLLFLGEYLPMLLFVEYPADVLHLVVGESEVSLHVCEGYAVVLAVFLLVVHVDVEQREQSEQVEVQVEQRHHYDQQTHTLRVLELGRVVVQRVVAIGAAPTGHLIVRELAADVTLLLEGVGDVDVPAGLEHLGQTGDVAGDVDLLYLEVEGVCLLDELLERGTVAHVEGGRDAPLDVYAIPLCLEFALVLVVQHRQEEVGLLELDLLEGQVIHQVDVHEDLSDLGLEFVDLVVSHQVVFGLHGEEQVFELQELVSLVQVLRRNLVDIVEE